jgi:hypothetical protein
MTEKLIVNIVEDKNTGELIEHLLAYDDDGLCERCHSDNRQPVVRLLLRGRERVKKGVHKKKGRFVYTHVWLCQYHFDIEVAERNKSNRVLRAEVRLLYPRWVHQWPVGEDKTLLADSYTVILP